MERLFSSDAICQNKVEDVVKTVSRFIYTLTEANHAIHVQKI